MPRTCTVCGSKRRVEIDRALVEGVEPYRSIAQRFGASAPAVLRHKSHLPAQLSCASGAAEVAHAATLLERIQALESDAKRLQARAEASGDVRTATGCIRESVRILELLAKLSGELEAGARVNILVNAVNASGVEPELLPHELRALAWSLAGEQLTSAELRALAVEVEAQPGNRTLRELETPNRTPRELS